MSQLPDKITFYFLKQCTMNDHMMVKWIYLESGHGKGEVDGINAIIKRQIDEVIAFRPGEAFNSAADLFEIIKDKTKIKLFTYSKEDTDSLRKTIPALTTVKGMANLHEVITKPNSKFYGKDTSFDAECLLKFNFQTYSHGCVRINDPLSILVTSPLYFIGLD